jgi:hypothetical protein
MVRWIHAIGLMALFAFCLSVAADDKPDATAKTPTKEKTSTPEKKAAKEKSPVAGGHFVGKLKQIEGAQRYLTIDVTTKIPQENAQAAANLVNLRRQLVGNKDPNSIRNIYAEMQKHQNNLITYKDITKKYEFAAADNLKVRTMLLPVEHDEKGRPRKLTKAELKTLKGPDPKAKGYNADFDDLKPDQMVEVWLEKVKAPVKPKGKDKDSEAEKPKVLMILILEPPPPK